MEHKPIERLTDRELQSLRNLGNEAEAAADEIVELRARLDELEKDAAHRLEVLKKILPLAEEALVNPGLNVDILDAHAAIAKGANPPMMSADGGEDIPL